MTEAQRVQRQAFGWSTTSQLLQTRANITSRQSDLSSDHHFDRVPNCDHYYERGCYRHLSNCFPQRIDGSRLRHVLPDSLRLSCVCDKLPGKEHSNCNVHAGSYDKLVSCYAGEYPPDYFCKYYNCLLD